MCSIRFMLCLWLFTVLYVNDSSCDCRQSYMTFCDSFTDISNSRDADNWEDLVIGPVKKEFPLESHALMDFPFAKLKKLKTLIINGILKEIVAKEPYQCSYSVPIDLILYGNELKTIVSYTFPMIPYRRLSLSNNKVETIGDASFFAHNIGILDLSKNNIELIKSNALSSSDIKVLSLRNNKLTHVELHSFPSTLEVLNLDFNKLRYLPERLFVDIPKLKELTLSHNLFAELPTLRGLGEIRNLDFSYNLIESVEPNDVFDGFSKLKTLDLGSNKISNGAFVNHLLSLEHNEYLTLSVAFNHLRYLNIDNITLQNQVLFLSGNPWPCDYWIKLSGMVKDNQHYCDSKFGNNGQVPYCAEVEQHPFPSIALRIQVEKYIAVVEKNKQKLIDECGFSPDKQLESDHKFVGCVA